MKMVFQSFFSKWKMFPLFYQYLIAGIIYSFVFALIYLLEYSLGWIKVFPTIKNVIGWDAGYYYTIKESGYSYSSENPTAGFFPFMAYLWRFLQLSNFGICLLMLGFALTGIAWLSVVLKPTWISFFMALSFPTLFYFALPYTESVFLFFSVMALVGWKKNNWWLMIAGVFLASLSRVSALFLVLSMSFAIILEIKSRKEIFSASIKILSLSLAVALGILLVLWIQYSQTGVWAAYFKAQTEFWDRGFKIPVLPFGCPGGRMILWMEIFGLMLGLICMAQLISIKYYRGRKNIFPDSMLVAACSFLFLTFLSEIFFNPQWWTYYSMGGTWITGLTRYLFCNPFWFIFIFHFFKPTHSNFSFKKLVMYLVLIAVILLSVIDYELVGKKVWYEYQFYTALGLIVYFLAYSFPFKPLRIAMIAVQIFLQVFYAGYFLSGMCV